MDKKSYKNILIYGISYKNLIGAKPLRIMFNKVDEFIRVYDGTRYLVYLVVNNMMPFRIGLDILEVKKLVFHMLFSKLCKNQN